MISVQRYNDDMRSLTTVLNEVAARIRQLEAIQIPDAGGYAIFYNLTEIDNGDSPYTIVDSDVVITCDTSAGNVTVNLPAIASSLKRVLFIKNTDVGVVTVDANGAETIDGQLTATLNVQYEAIMLIGTSTEWSII